MARAVVSRLLHEPTLRLKAPPARARPTSTCRRCASCSGSRPARRRARSAPAEVTSLEARRRAAAGDPARHARQRAGAGAGAAAVAERLPGEVELVPITTSGDAPLGAPPAAGDKSRFVKEIEEALLAGEVDLAVHSAKDVPGELPGRPRDRGRAGARRPARRALRRRARSTSSREGARGGHEQPAAPRAQLLAAAARPRRARPARERGHAPAQARRGRLRRDRARARRPRRGSAAATRAPPSTRRAHARARARAAWRSRRAPTTSAPAERPARSPTADALAALHGRARAGGRARGHLPHARRRARGAADGEPRAVAPTSGLPDGSHWIRDALRATPRSPPRSGARWPSGCCGRGRRAARRGRARRDGASVSP